MATNTTNYGWTKPDYEDDADIVVLNETFDAIDEQVKTNENNISLIKQVPTVESGDNGKVLTAGTNGEYSWVTASGGGGTSDYTQLTNLPQINSTTLTGNKSLSDLGIAAAADIPSVPITEIQKNSTTISPVSGVVNITVPTTAADVSALPASTKYAGASTAGGSATSAAKLDTASAGSTTQPVYFANGVPTATTYSLAKSVPADAVFTDTTYSTVGSWNTTGLVKNGSTVTSSTGYTACPIITGIPYYKEYESKSAASGGTAVSLCTTGEKYTWNNKQSALTTTQLNAVNSGINSTKVAQIATNEENISKITPTTTYKTNHAFQSANYELINDVYIDVPDGKRIFLVVGAKQANVTGIAVCFNTTTYDATKIVISQEVSTAQQMISCAGCYDNGNGGKSYRLSVFAKGVAGSQLNCRVTLSWWYL